MRIGTRASALALVQARWVAERLDGAEIVEITTAGDRGLGVGDKSRWVSTIETALLAGEIDAAVHSAKDVPGEIADGTVLAAIPARADVTDVLVGRLEGRVGTASLRRAAQLRAVEPDVEIVELRGNVPTRLRKLDEGACEGVVLAQAGLERLGLLDRVSRVLDLVPAPGQGALAIQTRTSDAARVAGLTDAVAFACVLAERELALALGASCNTPMGAVAHPVGDEVELTGWVGLADGSEWIRDSAVAPAGEVGRVVAERMLAVGARELLIRAEQEEAA